MAARDYSYREEGQRREVKYRQLWLLEGDWLVTIDSVFFFIT